MNGNMHLTPEHDCPACKMRFNSVLLREGQRFQEPHPGELTLCGNCTSFLRFGEGWNLILLTEAEVGELDDDMRIQLVRARKWLQSQR